MAVRTGSSFSKELNLDSGRHCRFYALFINNLGGGSHVGPFSMSIRQYLERLGEEEKRRLVSNLIDARDQNLIQDARFEWLSSSRFARNVIWVYLNLASDSTIAHLSGMDPQLTREKSNFQLNLFRDILAGVSFPDSERPLADIIHFFDTWRVPLDNKINLIDGLKHYWVGKRSEKLKLNWLDKDNPEQCSWAWGYTQSMSSKFGIFLPCNIFQPTNHEEEYFCVMALLQHWDADRYIKELCIMKFKKAWDQYVYRRKQVGRKPLNTYIAEEVKEMLDTLSKERDEKMYTTLERIIKNAYLERRG